MRIGIIADSHDNLPKLDKAIDIFNREKVDMVFHAGDFIAPFSVVRLRALSCEFFGVFGNNDGERNGLSKTSGGKIKNGPLITELDNKKILLLHDIKGMDLKKQDFDLILFGHTHKPEVKEQDGYLLFNPGECCGWLTHRSSIGIIDLFDLSNQIIEI